MHAIDTNLFYAVNSLAGHSAWLDSVFVFITINLYWLLWLLFLLLLIVTVDDVNLGKRIKRIVKRTSEIKKIDFKLLAVVVISSGIGYLVSQAVGLLAQRSRPYVDLAGVVKLITDPVSLKSFPSDHATMSFVLAFSIYFRHKKWGSIFIFLASLVALSRVYIGVHYPFDILAGVFLAWLVSYGINRTLYHKS